MQAFVEMIGESGFCKRLLKRLARVNSERIRRKRFPEVHYGCICVKRL